jgi:dienelactone hydrolase
LQKVAEYPEAIIPVERTAAPILLICGDADTVWPSCEMSEMIKARLLQKGKAAPVLLRYPQAGHGVFGPALPPGSRSARTWSMLGGTESANMAARQDSWPKTIEFLRQKMSK